MFISTPGPQTFRRSQIGSSMPAQRKPASMSLAGDLQLIITFVVEIGNLDPILGWRALAHGRAVSERVPSYGL